jgi:DNA-binding transcriptional MerR regulator
MRELEEATGHPARLIRYLISEGVVPPPEGATRAATYDERHVEALRRYADLKSRGVASLDVIRAELAKPDAQPEEMILQPADGVELRIAAHALQRLDVEAVLEKLRADLTTRVGKDEVVMQGKRGTKK